MFGCPPTTQLHANVTALTDTFITENVMLLHGSVVNFKLHCFGLATQIRAFDEAAVVIGANGAGFAHLIHSKPGTLVLDLVAEQPKMK